MSLLDTLTKSLVDLYSKKLSAQEQAELISCIEVIANDQKYNKFANFFPDEGEYRRELYPKHIAFFNAGSEYKERCCLAANRTGKCLQYQQLIETCDKGTIAIGDMYRLQETFYVNAFNIDTGKVVEGKAGKVFRKEKQEECVKLFLSNGKTIECALDHRVLTASGWNYVSDFVGSSSSIQGQQLGSDDTRYWLKSRVRQLFLPLSKHLQRSSEEAFHGRRTLDGVACAIDRVFGLLQRSLICLQQSISGHDRKDLPLDARHSMSIRSDSLYGYPVYFHLHDERLPSAPSSARFASPLPIGAPPLPFASLPEDVQEHRHTNSQKEGVDLLSNLYVRFHSAALFVASQFDAFCTIVATYQHLSVELLRSFFVSFCLLLPSGVTGLRRFPVACDTSFLNGISIIAYKLVGSKDVYDFEVETHHNYILNGIVNHNSEMGAYESTCHATGVYPDWWTGLRFNHPVLIWAGGDTATTCRDIVQVKFIGEFTDMGSGMIPKDLIVDYKTRRNVPEAIEIIRVKHITGGVSTIIIKTYEQGRATWQGAEVDFIWIDEEAPEDVYNEALIRLMTTKGSIITTWTPMSGMTPLVQGMLEKSQDTEAPYPIFVQPIAWNDVPHLTEEEKAKTLANTPPQLRDARSRGIPTVGSGLIYPCDPEFYLVDDFKIPFHWKKLYALDVGWNATAAPFGAWDQDNDIIYIYSEHKQGQAEPVIHATAIKARGEWIKGVIDPAARGRSQADGQKLFELYKKEGLKIYPAFNAVSAGLFEVWQRLSTGRLKIFKSCTMLAREISMYHRNDKGEIVKSNDHLCDGLRYLCMAEAYLWSYPVQPLQGRVLQLQNHMAGCT